MAQRPTSGSGNQPIKNSRQRAVYELDDYDDYALDDLAVADLTQLDDDEVEDGSEYRTAPGLSSLSTTTSEEAHIRKSYSFVCLCSSFIRMYLSSVLARS